VKREETGPLCKRTYELGKRQEASDRTREAVLTAAQAQLEAGGVRDVTMESLARAGGVTRQTIHNLFGTKAALLEALFDRLAIDAGMSRMREVMTAPDGESMLAAMVDVFTAFWSQQRLVLKRIHGLAAIDPEFGQAVDARNRRRQGIAERVIERLCAGRPEIGEEERARKIACLVALTSFEFFDALVESCGNAGRAREYVCSLLRMTTVPGFQNRERGTAANS
jgi:AcrR family transcriptional regulator